MKGIFVATVIGLLHSLNTHTHTHDWKALSIKKLIKNYSPSCIMRFKVKETDMLIIYSGSHHSARGMERDHRHENTHIWL